MRARLFVAVAVMALVASACRSTSNVIAGTTTTPPGTIPPTTTTPTSPPPTSPPPSGQRIMLPKIPAQGVVLQAGTHVFFISLEGKVVARLGVTSLVNPTDGPGPVLFQKGTNFYLLVVKHHELKPITQDDVAKLRVPDQKKVNLKVPSGATAAHFRWADASPKSSTLLAQWQDTCTIAYLGAPGSTPTPVTGAASITDAPFSIALGWTSDGKAVVLLPQGICGPPFGGQSGVYIYTSAGSGTLIRAISGSPGARMWGAQ